MSDPLENALPNKTHLKNNRSGNIVTIIDVFPFLDESTNWVSIPCYHILFLRKNMRYQYITHNDLNKWSIITDEEYEKEYKKSYGLEY